MAGHVTVIHTEVLLETSVRQPLDPLTRAVLTSLPLVAPPTPDGLNSLLQIGEARVATALASARQRGLVEACRPADAVPCLRVTDAGRAALVDGVPDPHWERVRFSFRNGQFVPLPAVDLAQSSTAPPGDGPKRGLQLVRAATERPADWRAHACFPVPDGRVVGPGDDVPEWVRWRAVPIESASEVAVVVAAVGTADESAIVGFVTAPPDWPLADEPTFTMSGPPARAAFPELFAPVAPASLRAAWVGWAKSRAVPADNLNTSQLTLDGDRLVVAVPDRLGTWLRAHRADVFRGDTWVWVGDGPLRRPAQLDVRAPGG
ncbi:hypothetical protein [Fimbriiglobus ruber]|uniref:Uncharacterized protein n=1 Tax=Fimbriiglobus ruber TaxID=1908690 RepID=A0A225DJY1_9BACT|nr:hypothetical protein [Fimbriiglobus ruber]OWK41780.1 hypothetical protein FRUB_03858 [Fimbriiglobus ruber]